MAKDRVGNEIKVGDLVLVQVANPANETQSIPLLAEVLKIQEGGTILPGGQNLRRHAEQVQVTPGILEVQATIHMPFDPSSGSVIVGVVKVARPETEAQRKTGLLAN